MASYVQDYEFRIVAGGSQVLNCDAMGITCIESNLGEFQIEINDGQRATFRRQFEFASEAGDTIKKFRIINNNSVTLIVRFLVWRGLFRDRRSLSNDVQGINPVTFEEIRHTAYTAIAATFPAGGNFGAVQFINPVGSGKLIAIEQLHVSLSALSVVRVFPHSTAITGSPIRQSQPKVVGVGTGQMDVYQSDTTAAPLSPGATEIWRNRLGASDVKTVYFTRPVFIAEGVGIAFQPALADISLDVTAEILELDG